MKQWGEIDRIKEVWDLTATEESDVSEIFNECIKGEQPQFFFNSAKLK